MDQFIEAIASLAARAGIDKDQARAAVAAPKERDRADLSLPCFRWAKALGKAPNQIAEDVAAAFEPDGLLASVEAVGPFVNVKLDRGAFTKFALDAIDENYGKSEEGVGATVVIDYGSPNIAKPLLFHHLRSAVIGQALCNVHRWAGYKVVGINFLGDLGTAFGKLMVGIEKWGEPTTVAEYNRIYVNASNFCKENEGAMDAARAWAKRLEEGDETALRHWTNARKLSLAEFDTVYEWLGIKHDVVDGEKQYLDAGHAVVVELLNEGTAKESDGGIVIELSKKLKAFLIRKNDGASLYQTRDLAAARDRMERYDFAKMLYVVDIAQEFYFNQLFAALAKMGHAWADRCKHVKFGQVLVDGSRAKTREGGGTTLESVLQEGVRRARAIIEEKNPEIEGKEAIAKSVGTAAVIYCDLGFPTTKNIDFKWDEILRFDGRTGPYLQYVHASACGILRKGGGVTKFDASLLAGEHEWNLVRRLAEFPDSVQRACRDCEPSHVSNFLYDLAREFRSYHTAGSRDASLRVIVDDDALKAARLGLVDGVRQTLKIGLTLLGIDPLERM